MQNSFFTSSIRSLLFYMGTLSGCANNQSPQPEIIPEGCTSQTQVEAFKKQIADFYDEKDVVTKLRLSADPNDVVDCVRIEKQPSLKNSGLSAKDIPRQPTVLPQGSEVTQPLVETNNAPHCPVDTIPIKRPTLKELCNPPPHKVAPPRP
jgi:hypothetical protein